MSRIFLLIALLMFAQLSHAVIEVTDDAGNSVRLKQSAQRIISLAPNITEVLFHIGAGKQIVGADEYSNYPAAAGKITRVNNYATVNYELILSLQPDLVIAWQSGNGEAIIRRLRELGIPTYIVETRRLEDIPHLFRRLGQLSGQSKQAQQMADKFAQNLQRLRALNQQKTPLKVFYQIWSDPLITLNGEHMISDVIKLCGGENIFAKALPLVPYVNIESILAADPEVIIAGGSKQDQQVQSVKWQKWPSLSAVKNRHIYTIPADLMQRHSDRILQGTQIMCEYFDQVRAGQEAH
jgi:iron complex transport system substrate-binding protein